MQILRESEGFVVLGRSRPSLLGKGEGLKQQNPTKWDLHFL